jgi:hypothetical protein
MTLRIAVVVPSPVVDAWVATLLERLARSDFDVQAYVDASAVPRHRPFA